MGIFPPGSHRRWREGDSTAGLKIWIDEALLVKWMQQRKEQIFNSDSQGNELTDALSKSDWSKSEERMPNICWVSWKQGEKKCKYIEWAWEYLSSFIKALWIYPWSISASAFHFCFLIAQNSTPQKDCYIYQRLLSSNLTSSGKRFYNTFSFKMQMKNSETNVLEMTMNACALSYHYLTWLEPFTQRTLVLLIDRLNSSLFLIRNGVPQGSALGPV